MLFEESFLLARIKSFRWNVRWNFCCRTISKFFDNEKSDRELIFSKFRSYLNYSRESWEYILQVQRCDCRENYWLFVMLWFIYIEIFLKISILCRIWLWWWLEERGDLKFLIPKRSWNDHLFVLLWMLENNIRWLYWYYDGRIHCLNECYRQRIYRYISVNEKVQIF